MGQTVDSVIREIAMSENEIDDRAGTAGDFKFQQGFCSELCCEFSHSGNWSFLRKVYMAVNISTGIESRNCL